MAMIKEYETPKGIVSYWVVGLIQIDGFNQTAFTRLYGFMSKTHADMQNPVPIMSLEVSITPDIYEYYFAKDIMALENVTPHTQAYQIFKDFNIKDEQGQIFNFKDAIGEVND